MDIPAKAPIAAGPAAAAAPQYAATAPIPAPEAVKPPIFAKTYP